MELSDLIEGRFLRRVNRFIAEAQLADGTIVKAHLANTGRMRELLVCNNPCLLRHAANPARKTDWDLLFVAQNERWVCLAAAMANDIFAEWLTAGKIQEFGSLSGFAREVKCDHSRFDFALETAAGKRLVEVKSVNLVENGHALFPDAPTTRGVHHVETLTRIACTGELAGIVFVTMGQYVESVSFNSKHDPDFARAMHEARDAGVVICAYSACFAMPNVIFEGRRQISWG